MDAIKFQYRFLHVVLCHLRDYGNQVKKNVDSFETNATPIHVFVILLEMRGSRACVIRVVSDLPFLTCK